MSVNTLISVIIPLYNAEKTIDRCLSSIFNANYPTDCLEVIVVDNNSTDQSYSIAKKYPCQVMKQRIQGRSHTRNKGASIARGELLAFLDADTYIDSEWFIKAQKIFQETLVGGAQGPIIPSFELGRESLNNYRYESTKRNTNGTFNILNLAVTESPMINSAACIYRREAFNNIGGFDTSLERHEDIDLSRRICLSGYDLAEINESICYVIYHGENWVDYILRSFWDGFYKNDYIAKWSNLIEFKNKDEYFDSHTYQVAKTKKGYFYLFNIFLYLLKFLIEGIYKRDTILLINFSLEQMKILGRLAGLFRRVKYRKRIFINLVDFKKRKRVIHEDKENSWIIATPIRFIRMDNQLYGFDSVANEHFSLEKRLSLFYPFFRDYYLKDFSKKIFEQEKILQTMIKIGLVCKE